MIEIVIKIPEDAYKIICKMGAGGAKMVDDAIKDGIVLPKGHGRLIEVSSDLERKLWEYWKETGIDELPIENATRVIDEAPTIIEPDGGEENGNSD